MKKFIISISVIALFFALNSSLYAQKDSSQTGKGKNYVDKNKDGVCDNYNSQKGRGRNFVDKNNDGICDNSQGSKTNNTSTVRNGKCDGTGKGNGYGCRNRGGKSNGNGCCNGNGRKFRYRNGNGNSSSGSSSLTPRQKVYENAIDWSLFNIF